MRQAFSAWMARRWVVAVAVGLLAWALQERLRGEVSCRTSAVPTLAAR